MSSLIIIQQTDAVHLITDAAAYDGNGIVRCIESKVVELPNAGCVVSIRGANYPKSLLGWLLSGCTSFDAVLDALPGLLTIVTTVYDTFTDPDSDVDFRHFEITAAGWSERMQAMVAGMASTFDPCDQNDPQGISFLPGYKPNVPLYAAPVVMVPAVDLTSLLGREVKEQDQIDTIDAVTEGLAMIETQRVTPVGSRGQIQYLIGGFAELTTVRRDGITRQLLTEWPEDQIGMPIAPERAIPIEEARSLVEQIEKLQARLAPNAAPNEPRALAA